MHVLDRMLTRLLASAVGAWAGSRQGFGSGCDHLFRAGVLEQTVADLASLRPSKRVGQSPSNALVKSPSNTFGQVA
jgi:hypothetical protein